MELSVGSVHCGEIVKLALYLFPQIVLILRLILHIVLLCILPIFMDLFHDLLLVFLYFFLHFTPIHHSLHRSHFRGSEQSIAKDFINEVQFVLHRPYLLQLLLLLHTKRGRHGLMDRERLGSSPDPLLPLLDPYPPPLLLLPPLLLTLLHLLLFASLMQRGRFGHRSVGSVIIVCLRLSGSRLWSRYSVVGGVGRGLEGWLGSVL